MCIIGLATVWKLSLVVIGIPPGTESVSQKIYANIRILACMPTLLFTRWNIIHTVVLKDKKNKEAHEESAWLACKAPTAVKTVASLTREQGFVDAYSRSLGKPLRLVNRATIFMQMFWSGCTQSTVFLLNALVSTHILYIPCPCS